MKGLLLALLFSCNSVAASAGESAIRLENQYAAETPPNAKTGAMYLDIVNQGVADRLLSAQAEAVASTVELHSMTMEGDMMRMRKLEAIDVPSGTTTSLKPGGLHIMLIDLKKPLQANQSFPLSLQFEKAGKIDLSVPIRKRP